MGHARLCITVALADRHRVCPYPPEGPCKFGWIFACICFIILASVFFFFFLMIRRPPSSPLFPYTTLFRSALLHGGLLQRRLFRASCGCSGFHNGGLLFEPLDQFLAALLLKLAHLVPLEDGRMRSEEHTSELQSRLHLVCRLLLEKKKIHHMRTRTARPGASRGCVASIRLCGVHARGALFLTAGDVHSIGDDCRLPLDTLIFRTVA